MNTNTDYWEKIVRNPTPTYKKLLDSEKEFLISHIEKDSKVLDIGCGNGRNIETILPITADVFGIDNDEKAIATTKSRLPIVASNILLADAFDLPFDDESFNTVILLMTLVNFGENKIKALKEMYRVVKDSGKVIISVYSEDALPARMEMYKIISVPIDKVEGTRVIFNEKIGANSSEQFQKKSFEALAEECNMEVAEFQKIDGIAYIFSLKKKI